MPPSWTIAQIKSRVQVNGTYVSFRTTPDYIQRFVRPALFSTGHEVFELQVFGTALMARYRGWNFALTTAHQVDTKRGGPTAQSFVVIVEHNDKRFAVPPSSLHVPRTDDDFWRSVGDLMFFDYSKVREDHRPAHLDLTNVHWSDAGYVATDYSFVIGYPSHSHKIELDLNDQSQLAAFTMRWIRQDLQASDPVSWDPENRVIFVKHEQSTRLSVDPDGLSGSPVFSIVHDGTMDRHLRFEGIVTHGKGDRLAVLASAHIRALLDSIVATSHEKPPGSAE